MSSLSKRYHLPLEKFSKMALPLYLDMIEKHEANIIKFSTAHDYHKLKLEMNNAERSAQQLKMAIEEMEKVKSALSPAEAEEFDKKLKPYRDKAVQALQNFLDFLRNNPSSPLREKSRTSSISGESIRSSPVEGSQLQTFVLPFSNEELEFEARRATLETVENLNREIEDLHDLMNNFSSMVETQKPLVAVVEKNIEEASVNVASGRQFLAKAEKYKGVFYPLGGAVVGGCVGGPLGLLAGVKIGGLTALGGGILGFVSGHLLKKKSRDVTPSPQAVVDGKEKVT